MGTGRQVLARCGRCWRALELLDLSLRKHGRNCLATFVLEGVGAEAATHDRTVQEKCKNVKGR